MAGFIRLLTGHEITFHGCPTRIERITDVFIENIALVQLDGDELEHLKKFSNIPYNQHNKIAIYYGDMAKFIITNW